MDSRSIISGFCCRFGKEKLSFDSFVTSHFKFYCDYPLVSTGEELVYQYSTANAHLPEKKQE